MDSETIITWGNTEKKAHVFSSDPKLSKKIKLAEGSRPVGDGYETDVDVKLILKAIL